MQKRKAGNLKYSEAVLPCAIDNLSGYHISCYRKFVALPKKHRSNEEDKPKSTSRRSLKRSLESSSSAGIFKPECIFCRQSRKRSCGKTIPLVNATSEEIEESVKKFAAWKNDQEMLTRLSGVDFVAKEVK